MITFILTGTVGRVSGVKSWPETDVVRFNPIEGWALAYVLGPLIVIPQASCLRLVLMDGYTKTEAANILGLSKNWVGEMISRSVLSLKIDVAKDLYFEFMRP